MESEVLNNLFVFVLAGFVGFGVITRVSPLLHTPLMSLTNAISAISVIGAILVSGSSKEINWISIIGCLAVMAATVNVVSGFLITDRMLRMFKAKPKAGVK